MGPYCKPFIYFTATLSPQFPFCYIVVSLKVWSHTEMKVKVLDSVQYDYLKVPTVFFVISRYQISPISQNRFSVCCSAVWYCDYLRFPVSGSLLHTLKLFLKTQKTNSFQRHLQISKTGSAVRLFCGFKIAPLSPLLVKRAACSVFPLQHCELNYFMIMVLNKWNLPGITW